MIFYSEFVAYLASLYAPVDVDMESPGTGSFRGHGIQHLGPLITGHHDWKSLLCLDTPKRRSGGSAGDWCCFFGNSLVFLGVARLATGKQQVLAVSKKISESRHTSSVGIA